MCPLCIATSTLVLAGSGSAGGLAAITAKLLHRRDKGGPSDRDPSKKDNAGSVTPSGIVPAKAA